MAWDFEQTESFPETAEYFEKLVVEERSVADPGYAGAIEFQYRFHKEKKSDQFVIPGLKIAKNKELLIETKSELDFKIGDMIRFDLNERYRIVDIDYTIDDEDEYVMKIQSWRGLKDDVKTKVLTLK